MVKTYPVPLTKEEMKRLIEASMEDEHCYVLFMVAKTTGRRIGEYLEVKLKDIDFEKNIMLTNVLKRKKYVKKEAILIDEVARLLQIYVKKQKYKLDDYVFQHYLRRTLQNKVKKFAKKAGIDHNVSFHNFRHYFITELVRKGWAYNKIAKLTGHGSIGTLVHYDHAVASDVKEDALEALKDI